MREAVLFFLILLIVPASGCSLHSSMVRERPVDVPASYSSVDKSPAPPAGRWWERFEDDILNGLMEDTFRNNLDIVQAYERLRQSLALVRATNATRGPVLNIEGSGGRTRQPGMFGIGREESYSLSAAASYEIDLWGKLKSGAEAAKFDAMASEEDLRSLYTSISARVADLYYLAVEQRAQLELSDRTTASFQDTLERVESRYRQGLVPAVDLYQSRQNLYSAKAQRPVFEQNLATTLNALSVLTGRFPDSEAGGSKKDLKEAPEFQAGIPSQLLSGRPDIRSAYLRLKAGDERVAAAVADRFPSFNLIGSFGGASSKIRTILDSPNVFWNIMLQAVQPVIDSGRRKAEVERREAMFRENLAAYHKAVLNAFREVEDALAKGKASKDRIRMLEETASTSESALRLATERYMQGLTDYLPVLTGQLRHFTAQSNLLSAKRQLISARIELARALGGWSEQIIQEFNIQRFKNQDSKRNYSKFNYSTIQNSLLGKNQ